MTILNLHGKCHVSLCLRQPYFPLGMRCPVSVSHMPCEYEVKHPVLVR